MKPTIFVAGDVTTDTFIDKGSGQRPDSITNPTLDKRVIGAVGWVCRLMEVWQREQKITVRYPTALREALAREQANKDPAVDPTVYYVLTPLPDERLGKLLTSLDEYANSDPPHYAAHADFFLLGLDEANLEPWLALARKRHPHKSDSFYRELIQEWAECALKGLGQSAQQLRPRKASAYLALPERGSVGAGAASPGAGKGFAVRNIAAEAFGDTDRILSFNLSQLDFPGGLIDALNSVRTEALTGITPIAFWDEFDCREWKWLQYLLAPMQDGEFRDRQVLHTIGKCVFVFAGGVSHTFENFGPKETDAKDKQEVFEKQKGPDFKSRLSGYLDIVGPNPMAARATDRETSADAAHFADEERDTYPVRRALTFRSMLGCRGDERLDIQLNLLRGLLEIDCYTHGTRSMEKIVDSLKSRKDRGERIVSSDLPPREIMVLHVDYDRFMKLVNQGYTAEVMQELGPRM